MGRLGGLLIGKLFSVEKKIMIWYSMTHIYHSIVSPVKVDEEAGRFTNTVAVWSSSSV